MLATEKVHDVGTFATSADWKTNLKKHIVHAGVDNHETGCKVGEHTVDCPGGKGRTTETIGSRGLILVAECYWGTTEVSKVVLGA